MKIFATAAMLCSAMIMPVYAAENTPKQKGDAIRVEPGSVGPTEGMTKHVTPQVQPDKPAAAGDNAQESVHAPTNRVGTEVPPMTPGAKQSGQSGTTTMEKTPGSSSSTE